jgi:hypothetical protein
MDVLSQADLAAIETELGRRMVTEFGLDLSGLVLDMTTFATFIDSAMSGRRSRSGARPSRNARICGWSGWP